MKRLKRGRPPKYRQLFHEYVESEALRTDIQLVEDIDGLAKRLWSRRNASNPEEISEILLEISIKDMGLGNFLIDALDLERQADSYYKLKVEKLKLEYVKAGDSATVAESKARLECKQELQDLQDLKRSVDMLKIKRQDTDRVWESARSRLSTIRNDIRQA